MNTFSQHQKQQQEQWQERCTSIRPSYENNKPSHLFLEEIQNHQSSICPSRRSIFRKVATTMVAGATTTSSLFKLDEAAIAAEPQQLLLENGLIDSRVTENLMSPPPYGMEGSDIFYPSWFSGVWDVRSITTDVLAPCGSILFGGNATFINAKKEIGPDQALNYRCRFIPENSSSGKIIADRDFNIREIAKASIGPNSVVDVPSVSPNKLCCLLSIPNAPSIVSVDLIALARRQEDVGKGMFDCTEVVRQIVAPVDDKGKARNGKLGVGDVGGSGGGGAKLLKEVETASLYKASGLENGMTNKIQCRQRVATFLLPSQQDPVAYQLWKMSRGRPIDVRFYDVTYTKQV